MRLTASTYLCRDYDEAIGWFVGVLGWLLVEDTDLGLGKRWVRVAAPGGGSDLLLARASTDEQVAAIGRSAGGRVAYFVHTDDFAATEQRLKGAGVRFREAARDEEYGTVAVFDDLYGNGWDLIEPR